LIPVLAVVAAFLIGVVGVVLYASWTTLNPEVVERAPLNSSCDLASGPCTVTFAGAGQVKLDILPRGIPPLKPLRLEVTLSGIEPATVELDFSGTDMNMGFNRVSLESSAQGRFTGTGVLPVCVRSSMRWEALVLLSTADGVLAAPFRFEINRR
jgi:hypothetical protein